MKTTLALIATLLVAVIAAHAQGSLTPPGAPARTMKSLDQIEPRTPISALPFTISTSGSYYLTGNLTATTNGVAITVAADNVTIDLNGFTLAGGATGGRTAISVPAAQKCLSVRNGTITGWTQGGVEGDNVTAGSYENLRLSSNGIDALAAGAGALVRGCVVSGVFNSAGIVAGTNSTVSDCTISGGTAGIEVGDRSTVVHCTAGGTSSVGILTRSHCTVVNCTAGNNGIGINTDTACTISGCTANGNDIRGIEATGSYATISGCTVSGNGYAGMEIYANCVVSGCTIAANNTNNSVIGAGIYVIGNGCRIDGNYFADNNYAGLVADTGVTKTLIVRNIFRGAQFILRTPSGNVFGPFEDRSAGGGQIVTSSPWANLGY
jgi:parallel beta-helix repeat protein